MLHFYKGAPPEEISVEPRRVGVFPGAFNPVTWGHLALVRAAIEQHALVQVVFLLPKSFPHKKYVGADFEDRIALLQAALADDGRCAIASSRKELFCEIAAEIRANYPPDSQLFFLCGRDTAERIVDWDYGDAPGFTQQLEDFQLLAAPREGQYEPPSALRDRIHAVHLSSEWSTISSSAFREAFCQNQDWEQFVPPAVARIIRQNGTYD